MELIKSVVIVRRILTRPFLSENQEMELIKEAVNFTDLRERPTIKAETRNQQVKGF